MNRIKVVMCPSNIDSIRKMKEKLNKKEIDVSLMRYISPISIIKLSILRLFGYRIVHIHFVYVFPSIWIMKFFVKFCRFINYKIVWTIHNILPHFPTKNDVFKTKWFYENVDYHFVHYTTNIKKLQEFGLEIKNTIVINHPNFNFYPNELDKNIARNKLGIPSDMKVLLSFGYIRKYKGLKFFIEALENLGEEYYGLVVGLGVDRDVVDFLRKKERDMRNFRLIEGYVAQNEIQVYMNACDIVVLPYPEITTSGATLLAYAFSKSIVASRVGCMEEVVTDETGVLVKPEDSKALAEGIEKIFSKDYVQMGKNAYKMAEEKYSWEEMINKTIEVYEKVISKKDKI